MDSLKPRRLTVLITINFLYELHDLPPTFQEVADNMRCSVAVVAYHVGRLYEKGLLRKLEDRTYRMYVLTDKGEQALVDRVK